MNRKSQLEKFELRMGKVKKDAEVIKEAEIKNSTIEKQAEKIVNNYGKTTEDIFMIITRDSVDSFTKLWNNSMENVIRDTIRNEIKQVVQEELIGAYRGIMKGLANVQQQSVEEQIKAEIFANFNKTEEITEYELTPMEAFDGKLNEMKLETDNDLKSISIAPAEKSKIVSNDKLKQAIIETHYMNVDVMIAKQFKQANSSNNTLYQKFMIENKGVRGAWKNYVTEILSSI